ncbi:MAG: hypothetical protein ACRDU4_05970, partial [Mycobacterium sp.]
GRPPARRRAGPAAVRPADARVVDDIVVEFGNALCQDTIDAFIAGQPVNDADLRPVWRNTTSPLGAWDSPVCE